MNETRIVVSVVLVGTSDAVVALQSDAHMGSRFPPVELPRWDESDGFRRFWRAFERLLPLKKHCHWSSAIWCSSCSPLAAGSRAPLPSDSSTQQSSRP